MKRPIIFIFLILGSLLMSCNTDMKPINSQPTFMPTPGITHSETQNNNKPPVESNTSESASEPQASMSMNDFRPTFYFVNLHIKKYVRLRYDMEYKGDISVLKSYIDEKSNIYQNELQYFNNLKSTGITTNLVKYYCDDYVDTPSGQYKVYVTIRFIQTSPNNDAVEKEIKQIFFVDFRGPDNWKGFRIEDISDINS